MVVWMVRMRRYRGAIFFWLLFLTYATGFPVRQELEFTPVSIVSNECEIQLSGLYEGEKRAFIRLQSKKCEFPPAEILSGSELADEFIEETSAHVKVVKSTFKAVYGTRVNLSGNGYEVELVILQNKKGRAGIVLKTMAGANPLDLRAKKQNFRIVNEVMESGTNVGTPGIWAFLCSGPSDYRLFTANPVGSKPAIYSTVGLDSMTDKVIRPEIAGYKVSTITSFGEHRKTQIGKWIGKGKRDGSFEKVVTFGVAPLETDGTEIKLVGNSVEYYRRSSQQEDLDYAKSILQKVSNDYEPVQASFTTYQHVLVRKDSVGELGYYDMQFVMAVDANNTAALIVVLCKIGDEWPVFPDGQSAILELSIVNAVEDTEERASAAMKASDKEPEFRFSEPRFVVSPNPGENRFFTNVGQDNVYAFISQKDGGFLLPQKDDNILDLCGTANSFGASDLVNLDISTFGFNLEQGGYSMNMISAPANGIGAIDLSDGVRDDDVQFSKGSIQITSTPTGAFPLRVRGNCVVQDSESLEKLSAIIGETAAGAVVLQWEQYVEGFSHSNENVRSKEIIIITVSSDYQVPYYVLVNSDPSEPELLGVANRASQDSGPYNDLQLFVTWESAQTTIVPGTTTDPPGRSMYKVGFQCDGLPGSILMSPTPEFRYIRQYGAYLGGTVYKEYIEWCPVDPEYWEDYYYGGFYGYY